MSEQLVFVGFNGGSCSTLTLPFEVFSYAASRAAMAQKNVPQMDLAIITPDDGPMVKTGVFSAQPTHKVASIDSPRMVFLTGMDIDVDTSLEAHACIGSHLTRWYKAGAMVAAVCPAQGLVAQSGLLEGKTSAIHWSLYDHYSKKWPEVNWRADDMVVEQENIFTCCGGTASLDLSLYLVNRIFGENIMLECARWFVTETPRMRNEIPPPIFAMPETTDQAMKDVQGWLHTNFTDTVVFDEVAKRFGMSERTFYRRFQSTFGETPKTYLQKLRLAAARRLLEAGTTQIEAIGRQVGYEDPIFFRTIFKRYTGMTPSQYRERFRFRSLGQV
ncbi:MULTISPECIES: GlxA family transcriptional regulator [Kordiimonas]|jgi:transcriptional regulator GlxA family with amidase domain|uniref:GlxA family transcriptional regulator n=1 Tax=Kordiimonas TaxID=288021 RepID=UPI002580FC94|nr:helix-turn-helix domain-containing protein [Kordiimonas sp. UBA4487]